MSPTLCACGDDDSGDDDDIGAGEGEGEGEECIGVWSAMSDEGAPPVEHGADVVWTGDELIVLGGISHELYLEERIGAIYNPATDSWRPMSPGVAADPTNAIDHVTSVWTGTEMIVWELRYPLDGWSPLECTGGRYSLAEDRWRTIGTDGVPAGYCGLLIAGWTGQEYLFAEVGNGYRYDPNRDSWTAMAAGDVVGAAQVGGWTDHGLLVAQLQGQVGAIYHADSDSWAPMSFENAPQDMTQAGGRLAGGRLFVAYEDGGRHGPPAATVYDPEVDDWSPIASPPVANALYQAGDTVLMFRSNRPQEAAALYDPSADEWIPLCTRGAPTGLLLQWLRWTGEEMLVIGADVDSTRGARLRL